MVISRLTIGKGPQILSEVRVDWQPSKPSFDEIMKSTDIEEEVGKRTVEDKKNEFERWEQTLAKWASSLDDKARKHKSGEVSVFTLTSTHYKLWCSRVNEAVAMYNKSRDEFLSFVHDNQCLHHLYNQKLQLDSMLSNDVGEMVTSWNAAAE